MVKQAEGWRVSWDASDIHPRLADGSHLVLKRSQPARAALQDSAGTPLFTPTPVVTVGINPAAVRDLPGLAARLAAVPALQTTAGEITSAVNAAGKDQFVPIITLRRPAYEQIKAQIYALPGTQFQSETRLLPPTSNFARPLLGSVGPATAEIVEASRDRSQAGDTVGLSGLQQALDAQLRGTPGVEVYAASDADATLGAKLGTVTSPVAGKPVRLTLDTAVQTAADATLADEPLPASIVALQPSTGKILAVANSASAPGDIALTGQYPAGSTFKIATYAAALQTDPALTADTAVDCPATVTVDGRTFENENRFAHGRDPADRGVRLLLQHHRDRRSAPGCRPAPWPRPPPASGWVADWTLPVPAFSGSMPATASGTEQAAEAIGQGKVLVSPLLMASMAGAAASGRPVAPSLVTGQQADPGPALDARLTSTLNALMRATVAMPGATGYAVLHDLPGEIRGKTGTAEFGTDTPPKSHSWFAGVRGDLAHRGVRLRRRELHHRGGSAGQAVLHRAAAEFVRWIHDHQRCARLRQSRGLGLRAHPAVRGDRRPGGARLERGADPAAHHQGPQERQAAPHRADLRPVRLLLRRGRLQGRRREPPGLVPEPGREPRGRGAGRRRGLRRHRPDGRRRRRSRSSGS